MNASNQVVQAYVNGPGMDQPIEQIGFINGTPRNRQSYHTDGLGSIAALADESGEILQSYTYAAFGGIRAKTGTDLNRVTYTAREAIGDSLGFYYYRNRVLDPTSGRFISEDGLGFIDGPNRYIYVLNNPIIYMDPFGWTNQYAVLWEYIKAGQMKSAAEGAPVCQELDAPAAVTGVGIALAIVPSGEGIGIAIAQLGLTLANQGLNSGVNPELYIQPIYQDLGVGMSNYYCIPLQISITNAYP